MTRTAGSPHEDLLAALHDVMSHELDRRVLLETRTAGKEIGWSALYRAVGEPSRQPFQDALDRLHDHLLINRRLRPAGRQHRTTISPTPRGIQFADLFLGIAQQGSVPENTPMGLRRALREEMLGTHRHSVPG